MEPLRKSIEINEILKENIGNRWNPQGNHCNPGGNEWNPEGNQWNMIDLLRKYTKSLMQLIEYEFIKESMNSLKKSMEINDTNKEINETFQEIRGILKETNEKP